MSRKRQPFNAMVARIVMRIDNTAEEVECMIHHVICLRLVRAEVTAKMTLFFLLRVKMEELYPKDLLETIGRMFF